MARKSKTRSSRGKSASEIHLQPARLDQQKLKQLYSSMLRCRMVAEKIDELRQNGRLDRSTAPECAHEAVAAGVLLDLKPEDCVAPGWQSVTSRLVRGHSVKLIIAELFGCKRLSSRKNNQATLDVIPDELKIPAQINIALGVAWGARSGGESRVAVSLCGGGSIPLDVWGEAVNFSVLNKLPVLHVAQSSFGDGRGTAWSSLVESFAGGHPALPVLRVDGDDVVAVYRVAQEAVRRARQGRGPALIECQTSARASAPLVDVSVKGPQSFVLHASPTSGERAVQPVQDPIARMENYLQREGLWSERWKRSLVARFAREMDGAIASAEKSFVPKPSPTGGERLGTAASSQTEVARGPVLASAG
jgi:TPP-dependent pyruvate/acetoin dehydrogenase alpha subunit